VHDAALVRRGERRGRGTQDDEDDGERKGALLGEDRLERAPLDELHRHERDASGLPHPVHGHHVRVVERRHHPCLALEALGDRVRRRQRGRQHLQRDGAAQLALGGAIDDPHRASAELALHLVLGGEMLAERRQERVGRTGGEGHRGAVERAARGHRSTSGRAAALRAFPESPIRRVRRQ
jgi:hypothetical protein